jgi:hypothetical protein
MDKIIISVLLVLIVIFVIPIVVYGIGSVVFGLKQPESTSPLMFLLSVFIMKIGTVLGFVLLFYFARGVFGTQPMLYAGIWFAMYTVIEIGQALVPNYSWKDALAGIISEAMYFPLSALIVQWLLKA